MKIKHMVSILILVLPALTQATTWGKKQKIDDPIVPGEQCVVQKVKSHGSYIYQWDSKYDQVFWPYIDERGIWSCKKSGYVALLGDFEALSTEEIESIRNYLSGLSSRKSDMRSKLDRLEGIYELRIKNDEFNNRLLRLLARWHQELGDFERANNYREKALAGIKADLVTELSTYQRMTYLYLAANYSRQLGDPSSSDKYLKELEKTMNSATSDPDKGAASYFSTLINDTLSITEGGKLDPAK